MTKYKLILWLPFWLFVLALYASSAQASSTEEAAPRFHPHGLERLPVLHEGRVKPIDSFARYHFKKFTGRTEGAREWLAESLFNPAFAENVPVLLIRNTEVIALLGLPHTDSKRYSFNDLSTALRRKQDIVRSVIETPQEEWSPAQADLIEAHQNTTQFGDILSSLTLYLPLNVRLPDSIAPALRPLADRKISYADVKPLEGFLRSYLETIIGDKDEDVTSYNEAEQAATLLSFSMAKIAMAGQNSRLFAVIPHYGAPAPASDNTEDVSSPWHTPWQAIQAPVSLEAEAQSHPDFLYLWQQLAEAYHRSDQGRWDHTIARLQAAYNDVPFPESYRPAAIKAEYLYNKIEPYYLSSLLYAAALACFLAFTFFGKGALLQTAYGLMLSGLVFHVAGILARIYILQRPPVSTLYESVLFVGLVCVAYGLWLYRRKKGDIWLALSAIVGVLIHILGFSHVQDGDSFLMLPAVLNTNFWLATHVIVITMGYAFCLLTSLLAHYYLLITPRGDTGTLPLRGMQHLALLSLLFSAAGTILGGIWADQSWGRFWGWDPKENGALLICLWLIWMIHGYIGGMMGALIYLAGMAYLSVIVALSWFGVNMLGVGLHSYGFMDQAAIALGGIVLFETLLIAFLYFRARRYQKLANKTA